MAIHSNRPINQNDDRAAMWTVLGLIAAIALAYVGFEFYQGNYAMSPINPPITQPVP